MTTDVAGCESLVHAHNTCDECAKSNVGPCPHVSPRDSATDCTYTLAQVREMGWLPPGLLALVREIAATDVSDPASGYVMRNELLAVLEKADRRG